MARALASVEEEQGFVVRWVDPEDSQHTWVWDDMHNPYPLTPLSMEFALRIYDRFSDVLGGNSGGRATIWPLGYRYTRSAWPAAPPRGGAQARRRVAREARKLRHTWERECLPSVRATTVSMRQQDYASMSLAALAGRIEGLIHDAAGAFAETLRVYPAQVECSRPFIDFCASELGEQGERLAALMMQGLPNTSAAGEAALAKLADLARQAPALAEALEADAGGSPGDRPDDIDVAAVAGAPGGERFSQALDAYLDTYGWRTDVWYELSSPTWREEPSRALLAVRRLLLGDTPDPREAHRRSAAQRRRAVRRARTLLRERPARLARFERLLPIAQQHVPVSEERALWQLIIGGSLRVPCLALGEKLARAGLLDGASDVFYLSSMELCALAVGENERDPRMSAAERRTGRERASALIPPRTIGAPLAATRSGAAARYAGAIIEPTGDERLLAGGAASAGVTSGRARVLHSPAEGGSLAAGDILVCRTTSPAWTPLFSRAGAVVTASGGVLSHSAIIAREYAIPCVVGVSDATKRIRDGATITVDGAQGLVRLEE